MILKWCHVANVLVFNSCRDSLGLYYYVRHGPDPERINIELFALRVVEEKLFSELVEEVDVARIHERDSVILPPYLLKLSLHQSLLFKRHLFERIDNFFRIRHKTSLT